MSLFFFETTQNYTRLIFKCLFSILLFILSFFVLPSISDFSVYAFSGGDGTVGNPYQITSWTELDDVRNNLSSHYILMNDLDEASAGYDDLASGNADNGDGWVPIGNSTSPFAGTFDGQNHTISGFSISRSSTYFVGLFGIVSSSGVIQNLGATASYIFGFRLAGVLVGSNVGTIENCHTSGYIYTLNNGIGGLAGYNGGSINNSYSDATVEGAYQYMYGGLVGTNTGSITNSHATGAVSGQGLTGGLVGENKDGGSIDNSYASGTVSGTSDTGGSAIGGLVGDNRNASITNSHATGAVSGTHSIGGLVGFNYSSITNSYATGNISGNYNIGGLVGITYDNSSIVNSYAITGIVSGGNAIGGLVGRSDSGSINTSYSGGTVNGGSDSGGLVGLNNIAITNSYSASSVSGTDGVGGLTGNNAASGSVTNSYAIGSVSGGTNVGGLVGTSSGSIASSYYDSQETGQSDTGKGEPKTTLEMQDIATFVGWDITGRASQPVGYPALGFTVSGVSTAWIIYALDTTPPSNLRISSIVPDSITQLTVHAEAEDTEGLHTNPFWFNEISGNVGTVSTAWQTSPLTTSVGLTPIHTFVDTTSDDGPGGAPVLIGSKLYGTYATGGDNGGGYLYSVNRDGTDLTILHHFGSGTDGIGPKYAPIPVGAKLYGTTLAGGVDGGGTIYSFDTSDNSYEVLHEFYMSDDEGFSPGILSFSATDGMLYGSTTYYGSFYSPGVIFSFDLAIPNYTVLHSFIEEEGGRPWINPIIIDGNKLYFATAYGGAGSGGAINSMNADGTELTVLYEWSMPGDPQILIGSLVLLENKLYGTSQIGGSLNDGGTIFSLNTDGTGFTILKSFDGSSSLSFPFGGVILAGSKLYGTVSGGDINGTGGIFSINLDGSEYSTLYDFNGSPDSRSPKMPLSLYGNTLFGTTNLSNQNNILFSFVDDGLLPNTKYTYKVKARDIYENESGYSDPVSAYTLAPDPTGFAGTISGLTATLSVDDFNNSSDDLSGFYFANTTNNTNSGWIQSNTWQESGLACGTSYGYTVKYRNGDGLETNTVSLTTKTDTCPSDLQSVSSTNTDSGGGASSSPASCSAAKPGNVPVISSAVAGTNSVTLTWSNTGSPVTHYLIAYGTTSGSIQYGNPNVGGADTTSYTIRGLSGGTTYFFRVKAINDCMPGDFSNEISASVGGPEITEAPAEGFVPASELPSQLFDIALFIDEPLIPSSNQLKARVTFFSFGTEPTPVDMEFIVLNASGKQLYNTNASTTIQTEGVYNQAFENLVIPDGKYTLLLRTRYNIDVEDDFKVPFEVRTQSDLLNTLCGWSKFFIPLEVIIAFLLWRRRKSK